MRPIDADKVSHKIKSHLSSVIFRGCKFVLSRKDIANHYEFLRGYEEGAKDIASIVLHSDNLVEAEPVKHGLWIGTADGYADGELVYDMWNCSECGYDADGADEKPGWNYCPNCGAKMDLVGT